MELKTPERGLVLSLGKQAFIEAYIRNGGDSTGAAIEAGYSKNSAQQQGWNLRRELEPLIYEALKSTPIRFAPQNIKIIQELANTAKSETVRLAASQDMLNRALGKAPIQLEVRTEKKNLEQLVAGLIAEAGVDRAVEIMKEMDILKPGSHGGNKVLRVLAAHGWEAPIEIKPEPIEGPAN